ncbi:histidine kinase [Nonomuraea sp. NPDC000554]|uniref:sensor histidine kinase n=1 Tax=Nonomuraea sp. NPDC000554 TaxID=3154259 RepID=UPI00332E72B2
MRWRGAWLDILLGACGIGLDLLLSGKSGGPSSPVWVVMTFSVLVGAPMAFVRRFPVPVTLYLAAFLVYTDQISAFTSNTAQMLLCVGIGLVAYLSRWQFTPLAVLVGVAATAINLADPGVTMTRNAWFYSVLVSVLPAVLGAYLRGPAGRLQERDVTPDVLLGGVGVALSVLGTWTSWHTGTQPVWANGLVVVVAGLALGVARRLPGMVFLFEGVILLAADQYLPRATNTAMVLALISVAVFAMRVASWTWNLVVYLAACGLAAIAIVTSTADITPFRAFILMLLVITPVAIGRYLGARQAATESERLRVRQSERLVIAQIRADRLAERERIAREVHDIVAHHVGAMVLRASAARYATSEGPAAEALTDIRDTGHQVLEDLRSLLDVLRDPEKEPDLLADPGDVVREAAERMTGAGLLVDLDLDPAVDHAPLVARASAARIVQEGLTNVLKHAGPGTRVRVRVSESGDGMAVEITNACPPTVRERLPSSGHGLAGMRERAKALGGALSAGPDGEGGWRLAATLPYPATRSTA